MLPVSVVNQILALATIFSLVAITVIFLALLLPKTILGKLFLGFLSKRAMLLAFFATFAGVVGSLYYSEFIGFEPCKLCWYQRVFLYPQAILLAIGLIKKHPHVANYCILFSGLGALVALYQSLMQLGVAPDVSCSASGVSCSQIFVMQYGFVTIPVMALTAFLLIIALLFVAKRKEAN